MGNSLSKLNKIIKYDNGYIYTIYHQDNLIYVGSTTNFKKRLRYHKADCYNVKRKGYNTPIYQYIRSNGDWNKIEFKIIDVYYNITKQLLNKIEGDYIRYFNFDKLLNCEIAGRTLAEYYLDNKEKYKTNYFNNKEKISIKYKNYYKDNKTEICNKVNDYRLKNKDKIKANKSKPWTCVICNKTITTNCKSRHLKTPRHINKANNQ